MFLILIFVVFLLAVLYGLKLYIQGNDDYWTKRGVTFVKGSEIAPFLDRVLLRIPLQELDKTVYKIVKEKKAKYCGLLEFRQPYVYLVDLDLIKQILVKDFDQFTDRRAFGSPNDTFRQFLLNMDGKMWKDTRAALTPTFTTGKIKRMFSIFEDSACKMVDFLKSETSRSDVTQMQDAFGRFTLDVIASAAFGLDSQTFKNKNSPFAAMGQKFQTSFSGWGAVRVFLSILAPRLYNFLGWQLLDQSAVQFFSDVVLKTIKQRQETGEKRNDFLQLIMEARTGEIENEDPSSTKSASKLTNILHSDKILVAQCILFFFAGFDTTETLLMMTSYELALNPGVQTKLAAEIDEAMAKNDGKLTYDILNELPYLDMVISETLRKYPPLARTERKCVRDYKSVEFGLEIKKGLLVGIPIGAIHYDQEIYPEPEKYIPERFSKENKAQRHPYAYLPFGLGPRNCIAMRFALTEGKAAIAHLVHNFQFQPCAKTVIPIKYKIVAGPMKPLDGVWLSVTPRK